jgi:hypothetical protein
MCFPTENFSTELGDKARPSWLLTGCYSRISGYWINHHKIIDLCSQYLAEYQGILGEEMRAMAAPNVFWAALKHGSSPNTKLMNVLWKQLSNVS